MTLNFQEKLVNLCYFKLKCFLFLFILANIITLPATSINLQMMKPRMVLRLCLFRVNRGSVSSVRNHSQPPQISSSICPLMGWAKFIRFNFFFYYFYRVNNAFCIPFIITLLYCSVVHKIVRSAHCILYSPILWYRLTVFWYTR